MRVHKLELLLLASCLLWGAGCSGRRAAGIDGGAREAAVAFSDPKQDEPEDAPVDDEDAAASVDAANDAHDAALDASVTVPSLDAGDSSLRDVDIPDAGAHAPDTALMNEDASAGADASVSCAPARVPVSETWFATGLTHSCGLASDRSVTCFGSSQYGQLGGSYPFGPFNDARVRDLSDARALSLGEHFGCALDGQGRVFCWGSDLSGQLGNGPPPQPGLGQSSDRATQVAGLSGMQQVVAARDHACARNAEGAVWCWGHGAYGQLGDGQENSSDVPVAARGLGPVKQLAAGNWHTCAILADERVACWGTNLSGQLGSATPYDRSAVPLIVRKLGNVTKIAAGDAYTCALQRCGRIDCWGSNYTGQLGAGLAFYTHTELPQRVLDIDDAIDLFVGWGYACALRSGGSVSCWGSDATGGLGDGPTLSAELGGAVNRPVTVLGISSGRALFGGYHHSCVVTRENQLYCWGRNSEGQLGDGTIMSANAPRLVAAFQP